MATVFDDQFSGATVQAISARAPNTGTGWTQHSSATVTVNDLGTGFAMHSSGAASTSKAVTEVLASADASITAVIKKDVANGGCTVGIELRANTTDQACYRATYDSGGKFHLYRVGTGGGTTELGGTGYALTWFTGSAHTLVFAITGSALEVFVDGTSRITATDATITAAGRAGIYNNKSGTTHPTFDFSFDRFTVDVSVAPTFNPALLGRRMRGGFYNLGD